MLRFIMGGLAALLLLAGMTSTYTLQENEQALLTRFGEIQGEAITEPGLHFKLPVADEVHRFDKRWLEWDGDPNQIPTRDKKYIWVDTFARWRIADPVLFYKRLRDERGAQSRLDDIIDGEIRNVIARHDLIEIVRTSSRKFESDGSVDDSGDNSLDPGAFTGGGREDLRKEVVEKASSVMPDYGLELADVRIKRINYVQSVQTKVFERMISERQRIAERYRSEGQGKSAEILGQIERKLKEIESEAYRKATEVRGRADAKAASIYAEAYNKDPEFYRLLKTLETYEKTIDGNTQLVLSTDAELLQGLENSSLGAR